MKIIAIAYIGTALSTLGLTAQDVTPQRDSFDMPSYQQPAQKWNQVDDATSTVAGENKSFSFGETWTSVDETQRHVLIMSSIDGFAAAGSSGPCFKESTNASIDESLMNKGFGSEDPAELPGALGSLDGASDDCGEQTRSYSASLIQGMSDEHLAVYLTGAITAYSSKADCPEDRREAAAMSAAAAMLSADSNDAPSLVLRGAFAEACKA